MAFLITTIISGVLLACCTALFLYERARGARYAHRVRSVVDARLDAHIAYVRAHLPVVNSRFLRQFFHYLTHSILTRTLALLRRIEAYITSAVRFNRSKARRIAHGNKKKDGHLSAIAAHKRKAQLSDAEKREHKDRALNGD